MWDPDDDEPEVHANASPFSKPKPGFSLDDAFSEDDGVLDATLEFNPATIRAALARALATEELESTENQSGANGDGRSMDGGALGRGPAHDRNGSVRVEDPDASVSTLDINASPAHVPGRAPGEWSRSTSYGYGYGYRQDSQDSASGGTGSLENFSRISLSDSVHDLQSVGISLEPPEENVVREKDEEGGTEGEDDGLFRAVHIDLSQGGKPRVEEVVTVLPEPSNPQTPDRDGARTPSPKHPSPPPLPSTSNGSYNTYAPSYTSTPTSKVLSNHQTQSQSMSELPSPTTYRRSAGDAYTPNEPNHIPPDSAGTMFSASSLVSASASGPIPTSSSVTSPPSSSQSESFRRGHRPTQSVGPSTLDKVISKTRPTFLPPKPKTEDLKHMADWETMMKQSRAVGEFRFGPFARSLCCFLHSGRCIDLQLFLV